MTSGTDELRRMLDERDEYYKTSGNKTWWGRPIDRQTGKPINVFHYQAQPMGEDRLFVELQLATPEQAIAATLGAGTCHNVNHGLTFVCSECGANVDTASSIGYSYVDEFGKRWYGASNDYGLNYCPNCGAKVVAE